MICRVLFIYSCIVLFICLFVSMSCMQEISQITSLSLQYPADEDVRPCRNNAACSVSWTDYEGKTYKVTGVINYLVANGPIEVRTFTLISLKFTEICDRLIFKMVEHT
jgi:hypothetical protein